MKQVAAGASGARVRRCAGVRQVRGVLRESAQFEQVTRVGADGRYLAPSSPGLP